MAHLVLDLGQILACHPEAGTLEELLDRVLQ
jgi:hypothetical protein